MRKKRETRLEEIKQEKAAQEAAAKAAASATNPATNAAAAAAAVVAAAAAAAASTAPPDPYGYAAQMPPPPPMFAPYAPYPAAAMFGAPPPPAPAPPAPAPPTNMFNPMSLPPPPVVNAAADKDKAMNQDKGSPFGGQGMRPKDGKGIPGLDLLADGAKHFKDNNKPPPSFNPYGENKNQPMITTSDDCKAFDFPKSKPDNQSDFFKNFNVPPPPSAGGFGGNMIPGLMEGFNPGQFPPNFNKDDQSGERHKQSRFSGSNNEGSSSNQGPEGQWTPGKDQLKTGGSRWGNNDLPPDESSSFSRGSLEDKGSRDRFGRDDSNDRFGDNSPFSRGGGDRFSGSRDSFGRKGPGDGLLEKPFGFGGRPGVNLDEPDRFGGSPADRFGGPEGDRFGPGGDRFGGGPDDRARGGPGGGRFGAPDDRFGGEPRGPPEDRFGNRFGGDRQQPGDRFGGPPRPRDRFGGGDDSQGFEGSQGDKPDDELSGDGSRGRGGRFGGPPEGDRFGGDAPGFRDGPGFRGGDRFGRQRGGRFGGPPGGDRFEPPEGDRFGGSPRKGLLDTPERFGPGDGPKFEGGFRGGPGGNRFGRDNRFGPGPDGPEGFRDEPLRMGPETDAGDASQPGPEGHDSFEGPPAGPNKGPVSLLDLPPIKPPFVPEGPRGGDGILGPAPDDVGRFNSPRNDDRFPPGTPGSNSARSPWNQKGGPDKSTPHESEEQEQYRPSTVHDYSVESDADRPGVKVIDYKHSKLEPSYDEPETLEPLKMFDYDHGSKRMNYLKYEAGERGFRISDDFGRNVDSNGYRGRDRDRNRDGSRDRDRDRDRNRDRDRPRSRDRDRNRDSGRGDRDRDVGRGDRDRDSARGDRDRDRDSARGDRDRDRERDRDANRDKDRGTPRRRSRSRERGNRDSAPERDEKRKQHPDDDNNKEDTKENEKNKSSSVQSSNSQSAEKRNRGSTGPKPRAVLIEAQSAPMVAETASEESYVFHESKSDKEVEEKGTPPRILSIDDYFIAETEKTEVDPDTGRKVTKRVLEYEYEAVMEPNYRTSLLRALKKTVSDGYFPFIIVDSVNDKIDHYEEMYNFAIQNGFQVYITEMDMDASACSKRNIHKRTEKEIQDVIDGWEPMPNYQVELDIRSLLQSAAITEDVTTQGLFRSKWDNVDCTGEKLDKLDGLVKARKSDSSIKDWLQLPDDYYANPSKPSKPGAKRVRWADLEERREQEKMRAIGFVVGQTDWSRMMDPSQGGSKLTQTKYI
ncbi:YLP motif-containing protein 1-like [Nilaparvata lugens]|uniref:YLP motif-containing protein 1-like n=1 Tax=Nilaparvata lugens TaxID=108931 RepID=UPI00193EB60D|nr:YLP motif-containing protein 1-like [Nilaparvata lugens]